MAAALISGFTAIGSAVGAAAFSCTVVGAVFARGVRARLDAEDKEESDGADDQEHQGG
jgi:hypothetical protein